MVCEDIRTQSVAVPGRAMMLYFCLIECWMVYVDELLSVRLSPRNIYVLKTLNNCHYTVSFDGDDDADDFDD
jgi:hypothetical protein